MSPLPRSTYDLYEDIIARIRYTPMSKAEQHAEIRRAVEGTGFSLTEGEFAMRTYRDNGRETLLVMPVDDLRHPDSCERLLKLLMLAVGIDPSTLAGSDPSPVTADRA